MKRKFNILLLTLLLAFASCSFTTKTFENPDKDKLLIQLVTYVLEQYHFHPKNLDDNFSESVFEDYLEQIDPFKRYFYESDIKEFEAFKDEIDNQLMEYDLTFFNLTNQRLLERIEESKSIYTSILEKPFDFDKKETFNSDYENLEFVKNKKELVERWRKQLKFSSLSNYYDLIQEQESSNKKSTLKNEKEVLEEAFKSQDKQKKLKPMSKKELEAEARKQTKNSLDELYYFIADRERKDWFAGYINAFVDEFDPHTFYFAPEAKDRFDVDMSGNYEGIGARLQKKMDDILITELISGGSAWRQNKLEVGDKILKVRQEDEEEAINVVGMRLDDAVKLIKGPKGTNVILTLKKVDGTIEDLSIPRDVIELEETFAKSALVKKEDNTFGVINLPRFYVNMKDYKDRNAASDIKKELERLKAEGMDGLVLDLRNNGGGSLQTVVDMVGLFIKDGPVVQVKTTGEPKEVLKDRDRGITWEGPLVVLVNELSASASEILAAAIQDYKRGVVIGSQQTYGKGTVQNVFDLNRMVRNNTNGDMGALKFTTQKFYRINGGSTQLEGVKSDIVIPDRYSFIDLGEKDQKNPLVWDKIEPVKFEQYEDNFDYQAAIKKSQERMQNNTNIQLIEESAKWVKTLRDENVYSLNFEEYKERLDKNEEKSKRFEKLSDYKTNLTFSSLPYEEKLIEQDSVLMIKRQRWHENLTKDIYVEEALNVLSDLKTTYRIKEKVAAIKD